MDTCSASCNLLIANLHKILKYVRDMSPCLHIVYVTAFVVWRISPFCNVFFVFP